MRILIRIFSLTILLASVIVQAIAQDNIWNGDGATDIWDDADNWSLDHVPTASEVAVFDLTAPLISLTITGGNAVTPAGLRVTSDVTDHSKVVTLDADITIGNGGANANSGAIFVESQGKLVVAAGKTLTGHPGSTTTRVVDIKGVINVNGTLSIPGPSTLHAIQFGGLEGQLIVANGGLVNIDAAQVGIYASSANTYTGTNILVEVGGTIDLAGCTKASINVQDGIDLVNNGTININGDAYGSNYPMIISDATSSIANNSGANINFNNSGGTGRAILSNTGAGPIVNAGTITSTGGTAYRNFQLKGSSFTNNVGAKVVLIGDNQVRLNDASAVLTNNGFITTTGAGYLANLGADKGTCINNGFYYFSSKAWPDATNGTNHVDNGKRMFASQGTFTVDANRSNSFNIGIKAAHEWFKESTAQTSLGTNDANGDATLTIENCNTEFYTVYGEDVKLVITKAPYCTQTITFNALENKAFGDTDFDVSATSDSGLEVTFSVASGPATISGKTVTLTGAGTVVIAADQAGDNTYGAAQQVTQSFEVAKVDQTISFDAVADKKFSSKTFDLDASSNSGLDVTFSVVSGPISISGRTVTITGVGTAVIAADQSGNDTYNAAGQVTQSVNILKGDQSISITAIPTKIATDKPFDVAAAVDSGEELTYAVEGVATIDGQTITLSGEAGSVTVTVSQAGGDNYNAASTSISFDVVLTLDVVGEFEKSGMSIVYHSQGLMLNPHRVMNTPININILDMSGKIFMERVLDRLAGSVEIPYTFITNKIYILRVESVNGISTEKIMFK